MRAPFIALSSCRRLPGAAGRWSAFSAVRRIANERIPHAFRRRSSEGHADPRRSPLGGRKPCFWGNSPPIPAQSGSAMTGPSRPRSPKSSDVHEQATTDAPITTATMELEHARRAQVNRIHALLESRPWLLSGRHLGAGLGDRSGVSQAPSRLIEGGVRVARKEPQ